MEDMLEHADEATGLLKGLANPHRLMILCQLAEGEKCVGELMEATGIAQTSMSQHLTKLKDEEIVTFRREHRTLYYKIQSKPVVQIMKILYNTYCSNKEK